MTVFKRLFAQLQNSSSKGASDKGWPFANAAMRKKCPDDLRQRYSLLLLLQRLTSQHVIYQLLKKSLRLTMQDIETDIETIWNKLLGRSTANRRGTLAIM